MKKMINRKLYDTDADEIIASTSTNNEALYRTGSGDFYLHSEDIDEITPLTPAQVRQWLEDTENFEELEELFPGYRLQWIKNYWREHKVFALQEGSGIFDDIICLIGPDGEELLVKSGELHVEMERHKIGGITLCPGWDRQGMIEPKASPPETMI